MAMKAGIAQALAGLGYTDAPTLPAQQTTQACDNLNAQVELLGLLQQYMALKAALTPTAPPTETSAAATSTLSASQAPSLAFNLTMPAHRVQDTSSAPMASTTQHAGGQLDSSPAGQAQHTAQQDDPAADLHDLTQPELEAVEALLLLHNQHCALPAQRATATGMTSTELEGLNRVLEKALSKSMSLDLSLFNNHAGLGSCSAGLSPSCDAQESFPKAAGRGAVDAYQVLLAAAPPSPPRSNSRSNSRAAAKQHMHGGRKVTFGRPLGMSRLHRSSKPDPEDTLEEDDPSWELAASTRGAAAAASAPPTTPRRRAARGKAGAAAAGGSQLDNTNSCGGPASRCLFAPTERWMREVQATIPAEMQAMIRADYDAKLREHKELDVVCRGMPATFFVDANTARCMIRTTDGRVITPNDFEAECGAADSKAWLQSILCTDYILITRGPGGHSGATYNKRNICLGHFTRINTINTSRRPC